MSVQSVTQVAREIWMLQSENKWTKKNKATFSWQQLWKERVNRWEVVLLFSPHWQQSRQGRSSTYATFGPQKNLWGFGFPQIGAENIACKE